MTKDEIIKKTLRESNCTPDDVGVVELLQGRLPDGVDIKTCEDFKHFNVECCDTCHTFYPESEMYLIDLPDDGGKAWVCDQLRWAIYPEEYKEFQERSRTQEELWKVLDYYSASFARDLDLVIGTSRPRYFGAAWRTGGCEELMKVAAENRPAFIACLFYTVLLDQGLYHHAHNLYKNTASCGQQPKFCQRAGKSHRNPRWIIRHALHGGLVTAEDLMRVAAPAATMILAVFVDTVGELLPQVSLPNFFHLLVNFPEVNFWEPREMRKYRQETKVEQNFLAELLSAIRECGF